MISLSQPASPPRDLSSSSSSSPLTFSELPLDIKLRVLELTREQDEVYRARRKARDAVERRSESSEDGSESGRETVVDIARGGKRRHDKWFGKGINALFLVNKELNAIAAPYRFREINVGDVSNSSPTFKYAVLPRHANHFKKVTMGDSDDIGGFNRDNLQYLLSIFPFLPNLEELVLSQLAIESLLGFRLEFATPVGSNLLMQSAFKMTATRFRKLSLVEFAAGAAAKVLDWFDNVRELTLLGDSTFPPDGGDEDGRTRLADKIVTLEYLDKIGVIAYSREVGSLSLESIWTREWRSAGTLKDVTFYVVELEVEQLVFLESLSGTLETLSLDFDFITDEARAKLGSTVDFPRLSSLTLDCGVPDAFTVLSAFSISPLRHLSVTVSLTSIHTSSEDLPPPSFVELALAHLLPNGHLRSLLTSLRPSLSSFKLGQNHVCWERDRLLPTLSLALSQLCNDLGVVRASRGANGPSRRDPFFDEVDESWDEEEKKVEMGMALGEVERVLQFGEKLRKRCERELDREGLAALIESLRSLKARFELELD